MVRRAAPAADRAARYGIEVDRALRKLKATCPHCGNADTAKMESNGLKPTDPDFTVLCVARVQAGEEAAADFDPKTEPAADGTVVCGMQWSPEP